MMRRGKKRWPIILAAFTAALCAALFIGAACFGPNTCGSSEYDMLQYLEGAFGRSSITVLKTAQEGRIKAVLYRDARWDNPDKGFIMIFERRLFGLRWRQTGMDSFTSGTNRLGFSGAWRGGHCHVEVYGDNRDGALEGYACSDAPEVRRDGLEADYILDIYILDGIGHLPEGFQAQPTEG